MTCSSVSNARTFLFVPGNRPERFQNAIRSGADAVVLDLEDAVPMFSKASARSSILNAWSALQGKGICLTVRINSPDVADGMEDLRLLTKLVGLHGVLVPKAERPSSLNAVKDTVPGAAIIPMIESASGYFALNELAASGATRLAIGHIDFLADTGMQCSEDESEIDSLRFKVAMTTRFHKLAPAIDGVTVNIDAPELLKRDTHRATRFGFGAKLCIHPKQVSTIHEALHPSKGELAWAKRVIEAEAAADGAAVQIDGQMVDAPVVVLAQRILARAGHLLPC